jgi:transcriptional regulator with XRE-family HTH domain
MRQVLRGAFGETIRTLRKQRKIPQERLALLAGIDRGYMGMLERAEHTPTIELTHKIICGLELPYLEFWTQYYETFDLLCRRRKLRPCPKANGRNHKKG